MNMPARNISRVAPGILLAFLAFACGKKEATSSAPAPETKPAAAAAGEAAPAPQAAAGVTGTIQETMDSGGYTYMLLKTASGDVWTAVNQSPVKKGETVTVVNGLPMDGFESKTLNRKFDRILFGSLGTAGGGAPGAAEALASGHAAPAPAAPAAPGAAPAPGQDAKAVMAAQHAAAANAPVDPGEVKVKKAEGANGKTIAEIYAAKASLKDKPVTVRGKVVKYNGGIMGRNWIHLRDGSGSRDKKDDDLTVTTSVAVNVGDVIVVSGAVHLDRDFGSGYAYPVIIEDATLSK